MELASEYARKLKYTWSLAWKCCVEKVIRYSALLLMCRIRHLCLNLTCIKSYQAETPSRHRDQFCVYRAVLGLKISGQGENIVRYTYLNNRFPPLHLSYIACCLLSTYIILQAFQFQIICIFIRCIPSVHRAIQRQERIYFCMVSETKLETL